MRGFVLRLVASAFAIWLAARVVAGIEVTGVPTVLAAAFLLGLVNATIRPLLTFLTLPLTILTLGLFLFVVNAAMLGLVAWMLPGMTIDSFAPALIGSILISLVSWLASWFIGPSGRIEVVRYDVRSR